MTCREFVDFIMDYMAGGLSRPVHESFERHLGLCIDCERYLAQYRATVEAGRAAFADLDSELPEDVPEDLVRAILASRK
jgi:anti-sigma factor RsiW